MSRLAVLLLVLSACASGPPATYQQAAAPMAPAFVPPVATPTGAGLYRPNASVSHPAAPLSPHKRVLPPTKGRGVWAGDQPQAAATDLEVLDVAMPMPPELAPSASALFVECVRQTADVFFRANDLATRAMRHTKAERSCVVNALVTECINNAMRDTKDDAVRALFLHARNAETKACAGLGTDIYRFTSEIERTRARLQPPRKGGYLQ